MVPVTVMVYTSAGVDAAVETVALDVPNEPGVRETLGEPDMVVGPLVTEGDTDAESVTLPVKPRLFRVTVDVAEPPSTKLAGLAGDAEMAKSGVTVTVTEETCVMAGLLVLVMMMV